ncbi:methyl-accepting chemotaxis protein [Pseudomonas hormoni]|uniref:Methyl-accepting chemotaxis protein n=3 Tax=Pseudomonas hormoni TaxID=3093767 RepID=A0ABX8F0S8_9PSED|nr:methyl-accepting chemotaxis protein [Pseudomonas hormoni]QVW25576.1 methyl-accepting chemotaxis protein [Pseudomonas hormoni]
MKNLSVKLKLALGFTTVVLLLVIVAGSGVLSLDSHTDRGGKVKTVAELLNQANDIRYAQMVYEATGDSDQIGKIDSAVRKILATVEKRKANFIQQEDVSRLESIALAAQEYQRGFKQKVALREAKIAKRASWVAAGNTADEAVTTMERSLAGTPTAPKIPLDKTEAGLALYAAELGKQNRLMRYSIRGYLMDESQKSLDILTAQFVQVRAAVKPLVGQLPGAQAAQLETFQSNVERYITLVQEFPQLVAGEKEVQGQMAQQFASFYENTEAIVENQNLKSISEASTSKLRMIALTVLGFALAALIAWLIVRQVTRPLQEALQIAERIGGGDMTEHHFEPRNDEFGLLLRAMDKTRRNLRELLSHVNGITIQLASAAEQLSAVTKQTSAGVTNQRLETDQVATAMNEMAATVHEVAQNAQEASVAAQSADKQAVQGNAAIQRALIQIDKLSEEVSRSADAVAHLNKESVGISTVLTVINGIAEQTNLLALNAAIEAARAGEAGRGFAVVADEVRGLAQRTQQSTRQIEELISNLQAGAQNAANMMSASSTLVDETVNRAHEVQTELAAITQTVSLIQAMNMQIATAAEEQSAVAEEINRSVLNVRDVAEQSAAASEETAASTMELARLGNELQQQVGRFKV